MEFGRLIGRVFVGTGHFSSAFRDRHAGYLLRMESPEGGFAGRAGKTDPYYTGFGLAGLALLGQLPEPVADRAMDVFTPYQDCFPKGHPSLTLAEFVGLVVGSLICQGMFGKERLGRWRCSAQEWVREFLDQVRRPDGGYAKHPRSSTSSTYATFLAGLLQHWVGLALIEPDKTYSMLLGRQRDDGGFAEWDSIPHSGTNPTAAAVGWLNLAGRIPQTVQDRAAAFLASVQTPEGGFRAHVRVPLADLLSTFTALVALELLEASEAADRKAAESYIASLELAEGGFRAAPWDTSADVEYTFYGLASLALLAEPTAPP